MTKSVRLRSSTLSDVNNFDICKKTNSYNKMNHTDMGRILHDNLVDEIDAFLVQEENKPFFEIQFKHSPKTQISRPTAIYEKEPFAKVLFDPYSKVAYIDGINIPKVFKNTRQASNILLNMIEFSNKVGMKTIRTEAYGALGAYFIARAGFLPENELADSFSVGRDVIGARIDTLAKIFNGNSYVDKLNNLKEAVENNNDELLWRIADTNTDITYLAKQPTILAREEHQDALKKLFDARSIINPENPMERLTVGKLLLRDAAFEGVFDLANEKQIQRKASYKASVARP
jgi:hypothetical protein